MCSSMEEEIAMISVVSGGPVALADTVCSASWDFWLLTLNSVLILVGGSAGVSFALFRRLREAVLLLGLAYIGALILLGVVWMWHNITYTDSTYSSSSVPANMFMFKASLLCGYPAIILCCLIISVVRIWRRNPGGKGEDSSPEVGREL